MNDYVDNFVSSILADASAMGIELSILSGFANGKVDLELSSDVDIIFQKPSDIGRFSEIIEKTLMVLEHVKSLDKRVMSNGQQWVLHYNGSVFMLDMFFSIRFHNFELISSDVFFEMKKAGIDVIKFTKFIKSKTSFKQAWPSVPPAVYSLKKTETTWISKKIYSLCKIREVVASLFKKKSGIFVVALGADGSGKSTIIDQIEKELCGDRTIIPVFRFHWRPPIFRRKDFTSPVVDPHAKAPRGILMSFVKLCYLLCMFNLGYLFRLFRPLHRGGLVILDRYYHDLIVDSRRYRYQGPKWLVIAIGNFIPQPDLWLVFDAPSSVFQSRKQEVSIAEAQRQREAYLAFAQNKTNCIVVSTAQSIEDSLSEARVAVLGLMASRLKERMGLR